MSAFEAPPPVWERLGRHGTRTLAVDPYESRPPAEPPPGALVCGWQLHDRVVLQQWSSPPDAHRAPRAALRPAAAGRRGVRSSPPSTRCWPCGGGCSARPAASPTPPRCCSARSRSTSRWLTFCAAHVAGHQFWDLSQLDDAEPRRRGARACSARTLDDVYAGVDAAIGRVRRRAARRRRRDGRVAGRHGRQHQPRRHAAGDAARDPRPRRTGADAAAGRLDLAAAGDAAERAAGQGRAARCPSASRSTSRPASSCAASTGAARARSPTPPRTRATSASTCGAASATASSTPRRPTPCCEEIADGLRDVPRPRRRARGASRSSGSPTGSAPGARADLLPDLIVRWTDRPATSVEGVRSERFGTVLRHGVGSGRSGNHTEGDAWALVVPGAVPPRHAEPSAPARGHGGHRRRARRRATPADLAGEPLLER